VVEFLTPLQERYQAIRSDKAGLEQILNDGAERAFRRARKTLSKVYRKVGFIQRGR